jgi:hypothetical protein
MSMLRSLIVAAVIVGAAYWYWTGPYQQQRNPDYAATLQQNGKTMAECVRAGNYKLGATGSGPGPEQIEQACAQKYNLYEEDGRWHSYDRARPN